jgi:hypothetical protein
MNRMWIVCERPGDWNIKCCGDAARFFASNFLIFREKACGDVWQKCGTNVPHSEIGERHGKT